MFDIAWADGSVRRVRGKTMIKRASFGLLAALAVFATPANAQNLVFNGSFEEAIVNPGGSFLTLGTGSTAITGWTVSAGSIDYIGDYWNAQDGDRSIDLAGSSLGTISQSVATTALQFYTVDFYASRNPDGGEALRTGTISFGGTTMPFQYSASNSLGNMNWQLYSYTFAATGPFTLLSFAADASAGCCWGPALDNVSMIAAIPEPEVWAMLLFGFGAIGFQLRRRGKLRTVTA